MKLWEHSQGDADRASGILFSVKPTGDWLAVRYNDTENNVAIWEFHNGIRRSVTDVGFSPYKVRAHWEVPDLSYERDRNRR
jgi:hypothetical protein